MAKHKLTNTKAKRMRIVVEVDVPATLGFRRDLFNSVVTEFIARWPVGHVVLLTTEEVDEASK